MKHIHVSDYYYILDGSKQYTMFRSTFFIWFWTVFINWLFCVKCSNQQPLLAGSKQYGIEISQRRFFSMATPSARAYPGINSFRGQKYLNSVKLKKKGGELSSLLGRLEKNFARFARGNSEYPVSSARLFEQLIPNSWWAIIYIFLQQLFVTLNS